MTPRIEADVIVLGAGIVGVSVALQLQLRGLSVVLIDRRAPGEETSFGNAGLIQREGVFPHPFPRQLRELLRHARNRSIDAAYHPAMLPRLLSPFFRYWRNSAPERHLRTARLYAPLMASSVDEHQTLAERAGATHLLRPGGWVMVHADARALAQNLTQARLMHSEFGIEHEALDGAGLAALEPHLRPGLAGAVHWTQPVAISDPHALTLAYASLFEQMGGHFVTGEASRLTRNAAAWHMPAEQGAVEAARIVIALGPWSATITRKLGYNPKLFVKRGYHRHFATSGNAVLNHPVLDVENGYVLAPMRHGIRLTTGAEFADRDAPPTPVQLARAEPAARRLMPALAESRDETPWMGARPCTVDMLPIIGALPGRQDAWCAFGHAHHGLTLGPSTGRLLAEMMTGAPPFVDPSPYRPERF